MTFGRGGQGGAIERRFGGWDEPRELQIAAEKVVGPLGLVGEGSTHNTKELKSIARGQARRTFGREARASERTPKPELNRNALATPSFLLSFSVFGRFFLPQIASGSRGEDDVLESKALFCIDLTASGTWEMHALVMGRGR